MQMVTNDERRRIAARLREGDFTERCDTVQQLADMLAPIFGTEDMNPNETAERLADLIEPEVDVDSLRDVAEALDYYSYVDYEVDGDTLRRLANEIREAVGEVAE